MRLGGGARNVVVERNLIRWGARGSGLHGELDGAWVRSMGLSTLTGTHLGRGAWLLGAGGKLVA